MDLSDSERRFLKWLGTYCAPTGTKVGTVSTVVGMLERKGAISRDGKKVRLTEAGWSALRATGWQPSVTSLEREDPPCICAELGCKRSACKGECGCKSCEFGWMDFLSAE